MGPWQVLVATTVHFRTRIPISIDRSLRLKLYQEKKIGYRFFQFSIFPIVDRYILNAPLGWTFLAKKKAGIATHASFW